MIASIRSDHSVHPVPSNCSSLNPLGIANWEPKPLERRPLVEPPAASPEEAPVVESPAAAVFALAEDIVG